MQLFAWISFGVAVALGFVALAMSFKIYRLGEDLTHVKGQLTRTFENAATAGDDALKLGRQLRECRATREQLETSLKLSEEAVAAGDEKAKDLRAEVFQANAARDEAKQNALYWKQQTGDARTELAEAKTTSAGAPPAKVKTSKTGPTDPA